MFKFITKLLTGTHNCHESTVEVTIDREELKGDLSPSEMFTSAVKEVMNKKWSDALKESLAEACYTQKQVGDTKAAIACPFDDETVEGRMSIKAEYPDAVYARLGGYSLICIGLEFKLDKFIENIIKKELDNV